MLGRLAAATLTVLVATAAPALADDVVDVPDGATITIEGLGHGHGRGLSQYGAKHAAEDGVGYRDILGFYYPGTSWGSATGQVRVYLKAGDLENAVQVRPRTHLVARTPDGAKSWDLSKAKPKAQGWRILPRGDARSILEYRQRGWHQYRNVPGVLEFAAKGKPITLDLQGGRTAAYRGIIRSVVSTSGNRIAVNVVPMESYLRGVVPAEVVASQWPQEAQRAQAVAARSYAALKRATRTDKIYDLDDSASYQVYLGFDREYPASDQAVAATAGEILTYDGQPAFTEFTASNGGWTVAGDEPYLVAQDDPWDRTAPWEESFSDTEIEALWPGIGDLTRLEVSGRDGHGEWGGRPSAVTLTGSVTSQTVSATAFYQRLGLDSSWLDLHVS